jgi:hypothetical protein
MTTSFSLRAASVLVAGLALLVSCTRDETKPLMEPSHLAPSAMSG